MGLKRLIQGVKVKRSELSVGDDYIIGYIIDVSGQVGCNVVHQMIANLNDIGDIEQGNCCNIGDVEYHCSVCVLGEYYKREKKK